MRIAVIGNCHGDIIAQAVRFALRHAPGLDCRHIVSYRDVGPADRVFVDEADRVLTQVTDFRRGADLARHADARSDRVGLYPLVACNFMYPYAGKAHPKAAGTRSVFCPGGYFEGQLSCSLLIDTMQHHADEPEEAVVDRYLALDVPGLIDLDRLHDLNRLKAQRIGAAAGLDLWPKIERGYRDWPMFWTYLHPGGELLRDLCRHALKQLRLGLDDEAIEAAVATVREPLGFAHMPIHPSVARHFGIEWARPAYRYRLMPEGHFTIREFALRFLRFEHDDELTRAIFNVHAGLEPAATLAALERARVRYPASGHILIHLAIAHMKHGRPAQAMEAAVAGLETDPTQTEWASLVCALVRQTGLPAPILPA